MGLKEGGEEEAGVGGVVVGEDIATEEQDGGDGEGVSLTTATVRFHIPYAIFV